MGWRHRRGCRGRLPKPINLQRPLEVRKFVPTPQTCSVPVIIEQAEIEALRLVDLEDFSQEEAGVRMGVSRGTIWRLLQDGRKKVVKALTEGCSLVVAVDSSSEGSTE
ncbi:MAG: DUF134 domain-containing protein [Candidatus Bathyarchaeota archaeon]|nr:DUF134 domain-containing protein [Candidatus Bathyarchaeota archaeon]